MPYVIILRCTISHPAAIHHHHMPPRGDLNFMFGGSSYAVHIGE